MATEGDYDLAILHLIDAGPHYGRRVRLTRRAGAGQIGHEVVFEFGHREEIEDFIRQLRNIARDTWLEEENDAD